MAIAFSHSTTRAVLFFLAAAAILAPWTSSADAMTLASDGRSDYSIVVAANAIAPEKTAAKELQKYLYEITGAKLPVVSEAQADVFSPRILVGQTKQTKALLKDLDWKSLEKDGIVIKTLGNTLILAGGQPRGTLYAVYTFLEDYLGCRFWTGTESTIPKKFELNIGQINVTYTPKLKYREAYYEDPLTYPLHAVRLKLNGHMYNIPASHGSHYKLLGWCHTFHSLIPPGTYQKDHPEWFSPGQLCLSNEEMRKELVKNALEWIRKDPTAGIISIAQNDTHGQCQCEKCRAVDAEEGSPSGSLIRFINKVAEDIEKEYPDFYIETLAYQYTRKPPLHVKPRHNVIVRLCSIECIFTEPLTSDVNKSFRDDIEKWAAIAPNLYIWDYVTNFANYMIPHPNMRSLAPNIRFFVKNNVMGVFEQGDCCCAVGDFVRLRAWLFGHLLWNPDQDEKALIREFVNGYYGAAGPYIEKYLNLMHDASEKKNTRIGCYHQHITFMDFNELTEAAKLFNEAEKAVAKNKTLLKRVQRERLTLDHVWLLRYDELKQTAEREKKPFLGPADPKEACKQWIKQVKSWKTRHYSEPVLFESYEGSLKSRFGPPPPKPEEIKNLPASDVVVVEEDEFNLHEPGNWCKIVDDPKASNGKAAWMPGNHINWAVQFNITEKWAKEHPGRWYWYAVMRCEGAKSGGAFNYGVYNGPAHAGASQFSENLEHGGDGPYHTYTLGTHESKPGFYFWVQPSGDGERVKGIYIDRLIFVRDKSEE